MRDELRRAVHAATLVAAVGLLSGCSDWLEVTNPGAIGPDALEDENYIALMMGGALGDFQPAYSWTALFSAGFSDELRIHHTYFENIEIDSRDVSQANGTYALSVYNGLHRARYMADLADTKISAVLADSAGRDARVALAKALSAYSWMMLGEQLCETRIDGEGPTLSPAQLLAEALPRYDAAITVAEAARAAAATAEPEEDRDSLAAYADAVVNLARVGAARTALNLAAYQDEAANLQLAIDYASGVAPAYVSDANQGFTYWVNHTLPEGAGTSRRLGSPHHEFITAGRWFSVTGTPYAGLDDPRIPTFVDWISGGGTADIPNSPPSFSTYDGTPEGAEFEGTTNLRLASALEARYIIAEAEGVNADNIAFLNERAALGGTTLGAGATQTEFMAALREQRSRDFFIDGHRVGDLRRYEASSRHGVDLWPTGAMYGGTNQFGSQKCWPTPLSELF